MHERWIRAALAAAMGSLIAATACGGSGDDDTDPSSGGASGSSGSNGSKNDAGGDHGAGGSHVADAGGPTKPPPHTAGADAAVASDAGVSSDRDLAAASFCRADCQRQKRCASADDGCEPACVTKTERWGEAFLTELAACVEQSACDDGDGSCYGNALSTLFPEFPDDPVVSHCAELSNDCGFDENLCPSLLILSAAAKAQAMDCLSLECTDDIGACLTAEGAFSP